VGKNVYCLSSRDEMRMSDLGLFFLLSYTYHIGAPFAQYPRLDMLAVEGPGTLPLLFFMSVSNLIMCSLILFGKDSRSVDIS
jgi:hypothetical protein